MSETKTIVPKYINSPQAGKKWASVNSEGTYYSFDPAKIPMSTFTKGQPISITFETKPYNGKDYYTITAAAAPPAGGPGGAGPYSGSSSGWSPEKEERVLRIAIAKSCIEANATTEIADHWIEWIKREMPEPPPY